MVRRKEGPGPLFQFEDGHRLTRLFLIKKVKTAMKEVGARSVAVSI